MSAYVVDRYHIMYLVKAARHFGIKEGGDFSYYWNGERRILDRCDEVSEIGLANMLWQENIKSVLIRYEDDNIDTMPGPIGEDFVITENDVRLDWPKFDPVQVIKSCRCYTYQSNEHDGWKTSEAFAFIADLIHCATDHLQGYDAAEWGAPAPTHGLSRTR